MSQQSDKFCTVEDVASAYGVDEETVRRWCRTGAIKGAVHAGRQWRIPIEYASGSIDIIIPDQHSKGSRDG